MHRLTLPKAQHKNSGLRDDWIICEDLFANVKLSAERAGTSWDFGDGGAGKQYFPSPSFHITSAGDKCRCLVPSTFPLRGKSYRHALPSVLFPC